MKKLALLFLVAVVTPSLVLAWLAVGSLRDQQIVLERQQTQLCLGVADAIAGAVRSAVSDRQREFAQVVEKLLGKGEPAALAGEFDERIATAWPDAEVGFSVRLDGAMFSPSLIGRPDGRKFRLEQGGFLCSREPVEVIWNGPKGKPVNLTALDEAAKSKEIGDKGVFATKSKVGEVGTPSGGSQFREIVGDSSEGTVARFFQDRLTVLFWYRSERDPQYVFGAQIRLERLLETLRPLVTVEPPFGRDAVAALRDENGRSRAVSAPGYAGDWRRPFVVVPVGEVLPHWDVALELVNPDRLGETARTTRLTLGLLIALLVLAIAVGSWLIVTDLRRQLTLAQQKTDFVSNVSHELKTPLTSIRMFSEILSDGRELGAEKHRQFLGIIASEAARLARLINNVLDFARRERGGTHYQSVPVDLAEMTATVTAHFRPHLEAAGFTLRCELPGIGVWVMGDRDALEQVLVNLVSNAEKYAGNQREIEVHLDCTRGNPGGDAGTVTLAVLDRGLGVPRGAEERIFEQFHRAHDSLASGIPGSGLGLTLARQIARAHGGDVRHAPRAGGGSEFSLVLPAVARPLRPSSYPPSPWTDPQDATAVAVGPEPGARRDV